MWRFRIAIFIFALGSSVANAFAYARSIASISPYGPELLQSHLVAAAKDMACLREAVILTIAGLAWFLIPNKAPLD
jgi:hypothetical protein